MKQFILFLFLLLPFCVNSQVNETFDGPEIGSDWIGGDRDSFKINKSGRLQLAIKPEGRGKRLIGKNIPYSVNMQWEFEVYMLYAPSNDNKLCVYLYQESAERYYYVRIGNTGSKELGLMRHGMKELVAPQTDFTGMPLLLQIKVTLENNERWTLYSRTKGMTGYKKEGSSTYAITAPPERGNMVFTFYYTKTRSDLFSIDNVYVSDHITPTPLEPDEPDEPEPSPGELPQLLEVEPVSASSLRYTFDKPVKIENATFSISDIGYANWVRYVDRETMITVVAQFGRDMEAGKSYTISYEGVTDLSGNSLSDYSVKVKFEVDGEEPDDDDGKGTDDVPPGSVLINEVMAKPGEAAGMVEYVELYNPTSMSVSLHKWVYKNVTGKKVKVLPDVVLESGRYAILYGGGKLLTADDKALLIPIEKFPALNDQGASLHLYNASGTLIDSVTYAKATPAKSWERTSSGWHLSTDPRGGTPGSANSSSSGEEEEPPVDPDDPDDPEEPDTPVITDPIQPGDIVFNELLPDPYAGGSEYIELYNRSGKPLSLSALSIATRKSDGTLSTRYPLQPVGKRLEAGGYVLLTKEVEKVSSFYDIADPSALHQLKLPVLANTSSTLVLFRTADETVIIDEVSYSSKWHAPSVKNRKGVALERIDPEAATQLPANWTSASATAGYGTPGYRNSQDKEASSGSSTGIEPPVWIEETGSYSISYLLDRPGYSCRAYVFNTSGQRVAEISNHQLLGTSGELIWSGIAGNGSPLHAGLYIFYAEIYHPEGAVKRFKKAFLVR